MDQAGFGLSGKHARLIFNIPDLEHVYADVEFTAFQTYIGGLTDRLTHGLPSQWCPSRRRRSDRPRRKCTGRK